MELEDDRPIVPDPIPHAVEWAARLRAIAAKLDARADRRKAAAVVGRMADALDLAVEQHRAGRLSEESDARLREILDRLNESTWNGSTTRTKNDILRQASYGAFPQAADLLSQSLIDSEREHAAHRHPSLRPDAGAIDLSDAADHLDR